MGDAKLLCEQHKDNNLKFILECQWIILIVLFLKDFLNVVIVGIEFTSTDGLMAAIHGHVDIWASFHVFISRMPDLQNNDDM